MHYPEESQKIQTLKNACHGYSHAALKNDSVKFFDEQGKERFLFEEEDTLEKLAFQIEASTLSNMALGLLDFFMTVITKECDHEFHIALNHKLYDLFQENEVLKAQYLHDDLSKT